METNRRRRAPTCGYCCQEGHNLRSCREPNMVEVRTRFRIMVKNHERIEYIRGWINQIDNMKLLKMIVMKHIGISFHTMISKQDIVERTMQFVNVQQQYELQQMIASVNRLVGLVDHLRIILTPAMLCESYSAFFHDTNISGEEHAMVCAVVLDMPIYMVHENNAIDYLVLVRINRYLTYIIRQTTDQLFDQLLTTHIQPLIVEPVKYVYTESTVPPPKNTDSCPICFDDMKWRDTYTTECGHHFCCKCIQATINQHPRTSRCPCPMCRTPLEQMYYYDMQKYSVIDLTHIE